MNLLTCQGMCAEALGFHHDLKPPLNVRHSRLRKSSATAGRESTVAAASTGSSASTKASSLTRFQLALVLPLAARLDFQKPLQSAGRPLALPMLQGNDQPETSGDNNRSLLFVKCFCYARFFSDSGTRPDLKMVGTKRGRETKMQTAQ